MANRIEVASSDGELQHAPAGLRQRLYLLLETTGDDMSRAGWFLSAFIVGLIILNVLAVILETNQPLHARFSDQFLALELFSVAIFTLEYLARVWVSVDHPGYKELAGWKARLRYIMRPMALIDLMVIAPFYLALIIPIDLRYLRLFRLLRLLKLSHYFDGLKMFMSVLNREIGAIAGAILTLVVLIIISACLMFSIENSAQPGQFNTVSDAIWWSVVTLTTVGYGDITPVTFLGKLVAMVIMLLGVCTMALPAGILAAKFTEELQARREMLKLEVSDALSDGIIDEDERIKLYELQVKLGLPDGAVDRLLALTEQARSRNAFCPHCGEELQSKP